MRAPGSRGSLRPLLATILVVLWIVVIGTAVPFPLFVPLREMLEPSVPPLIQFVRPYLASLVVVGSRVAVLAANAMAESLGWETVQPPMVDAWLLAAQRIGAFAGMVTAAAFPTWCLAVWARRRQALPGRRPSSMRQVPLALALLWTIVVARPLIGLVGTVLYPVDTWLMLPSVAAAEKAPPPPDGWCAYQLHPSAIACEAGRMASSARRDESHHGFGFAGARCISAADVPHPECGTARPPAP